MKKSALLSVIACLSLWPWPASADVIVGPQEGPANSGSVVPTRHLVRPAGECVYFNGRPVDLVLSPDGRSAFAKSDRSVLVIDVASWTVRQEVAYAPGMGSSMHGMALSGNGRLLYVTCAQSALLEYAVGREGDVSLVRTIKLPSSAGRRESYPCGLALSPDGASAYVCLSTSNSVAQVDLKAGEIVREIPVGIAPYDIELSPDSSIAYVSNWGGRRPQEGEQTSTSAGSKVVIDSRGIGSSGTVSVLDLAKGTEIAQVPVGLHPAQLLLSKDGSRIYVANANSDTVSVIATHSRTVAYTINCRPDARLPFGSASNALALSDDGSTLFVANGGNNAIAVVAVGPGVADRSPAGFIPAGWYPGALAYRAGTLYVANTKGAGSRYPASAGRWSPRDFWGSVGKVAVPDSERLKTYTRQVLADGMLPQALKAMERSISPATPVPVPENVGEPSVFEHVFYIIKENRTYDQVLGDMGKGNSDPSLCIYGRNVTPNHHAIAEQFVLLDNWYCNGVISADGHRWVTEGITSDYLEKSFGAWTRSYPSAGNDALAYASSGFIWDHVLLNGLSFRNYGEMVNARPQPRTFKEIWQDYREKTGKLTFTNHHGLPPLERYTSPDYPGWALQIPDQVRADIFIRELEKFEASNQLPHFVMIHLPNNHTNGTAPGYQTPSAMVADNDLAMGRVIEAISKSRFWPKSCIFVMEDDPQSGFDHVDGHRSMCFVVSPYTRRGAVVSDFYNQSSVLRTMELILGVSPMNQMDAMAPVMRACFQVTPDLTPFKALPSTYPLDEVNPDLADLSGEARRMAEVSLRQNVEVPDRVDDDAMNRVLWHAARAGVAEYPAALSGSHGTGLKALGLEMMAGGAVSQTD